jgi:hypothetical protein
MALRSAATVVKAIRMLSRDTMHTRKRDSILRTRFSLVPTSDVSSLPIESN